MVALALSAALPIVCLVAYLTYARFESATERSKLALRTATESAAHDVSRYVGRIRTLLETLAHSPLVAALDAERCEPRLAEFAASVSQAANLLTLDAEGSLVCSALPMPAGTPRQPDPAYYFAKAKSSREFTIGAPALGFISRRWVVTLAQPILDSEGRFQGVVALAVDLLRLAETRGPIGEVGATGVLGSEGTVLWQRPDPATWIAARSTETIRLARSFADGAGHAIDRSPQGIETLYAYSAIPGTDWFAYSSTPTDLAFATARREALLGAAVTLAALLAATGLSWLIARRIAGPIRAIADNARAIVQGDVGVRIDERGPAELVDIAREINAAIEARTTAERAMRQSEAQFRRIFDRAAEGIAVFQDGRFVLLNEAATRLAGLDSPDLSGLNPLSLIHPEDRERVANLRNPGRQGEPSDAPQEFRLLRPDGSSCWVESRSREIDWQGRPAMLVILTDITERKSVEIVLRDARDAKEAMLNALPDLMFKVDRVGRIEEFHSSSVELLYLPPSAFLGKTVSEVLPEEASRVVLSALAEGLARGASRGMTYSLPVGGQTRWFEVSAAAMSARDTPPSHGILLVRDVTERRRAEDALREANELQRLFIESAPVALAMFDRGMRYMAASRRWRDDYRLGDRELIGLSHYDVFPEIGMGLKAIHQRALAGEVFRSDQDRFVRSDGTEQWLRWEVHPWTGADGAVGGIVIFSEDVTERRRSAEELIRHRDHLEELVETRTRELVRARDAERVANAAKGSFLANMSHEIRTPLNAVIGLAHLIRRARLSDEQAVRLDKLEAAAGHLLEVLNAILDLSKIDAGKFVLEEGPLTIESVVASAVAMLDARAQEKHLLLTREVDPMPHDLVGDATRLRQALLNYVNNAIKFTDAGSVAVRATLVGQDESLAVVRFEVSDTGAGIAPDVIPRLFSAFEQADVSTTRREGGTGLGLAITRRIAQLMGGDAGVDSVEGAGSTFWFTVRLKRSDGPRAPSEAPARADALAVLRRDHAGARVLVAEDNEINREVAISTLEFAALAVDAAIDGREAVEMARANQYALVLMDMQMPRMDGLEATREIRRLHPAGSLPIIAMTANAFTEDKQLCREAGMDDFLSKPVLPETLYALLLAWLERPRGAGSTT